MPARTSVDVLGVVQSVEAATQLTLKNGTDAHKRSVTLIDTSCKTVEVRRRCLPACQPTAPMQAAMTLDSGVTPAAAALLMLRKCVDHDVRMLACMS